jgi:hypothetical protein
MFAKCSPFCSRSGDAADKAEKRPKASDDFILGLKFLRLIGRMVAAHHSITLFTSMHHEPTKYFSVLNFLTRATECGVINLGQISIST